MTKFLSTTLLVGFMLTGVQSLITAANAQDYAPQYEKGNEAEAFWENERKEFESRR